MCTTRFAASGTGRSRNVRSRSQRRGAATVELAAVAPVFVIIALGMSEASQLFDTQNQLALAAREGGRLAAMDRDGLVSSGQTTNEKITADIENFLTSNGMSADDVEVHIVDPNDHVTPFDLDDPANKLELFELRVELPSSGQGGGMLFGNQFSLAAKVVFRNARSALVQ